MHLDLTIVDTMAGNLQCVFPLRAHQIAMVRATYHNMCNMWICFGSIGLFQNVMMNTKVGIMCSYPYMSAMWGPNCPSHIC